MVYCHTNHVKLNVVCVLILCYNRICFNERSELALKIDKTVRRETLFVAVYTVILSALMEAVFLLIGKWDYTVLLGNILGAGGAVLNFFLMGLTVQSAVMKDEKDAKAQMKASQAMRLFMMCVIAILGAVLPCFQVFAVIIPLFFPRIAVMIRGMSLKKSKKTGGERDE